MDTIKFGPSGADEESANRGIKTTKGLAEYVRELDLDCFEYSFGKGVRISQVAAEQIRQSFFKQNIEISVHAPYYINFANPDPEKRMNTHSYLFQTLDALKLFGGCRAVFHPGSPLKQDRGEAFSIMYESISKFVERYYQTGEYNGLYICPETMGKENQMGSVEEIAEICSIDKILLPCVDFGHVNAREHGSLKTKEDFIRVIDTLCTKVDDYRIKNMHVHFSKIEYGAKGEIRHLTFQDKLFGPEFEPFLQAIIDLKLTPYIVSESAGTQGIDAKYMKDCYKQHIGSNDLL